MLGLKCFSGFVLSLQRINDHSPAGPITWSALGAENQRLNRRLALKRRNLRGEGDAKCDPFQAPAISCIIDALTHIRTLVPFEVVPDRFAPDNQKVFVRKAHVKRRTYNVYAAPASRKECLPESTTAAEQRKHERRKNMSSLTQCGNGQPRSAVLVSGLKVLILN